MDTATRQKIVHDMIVAIGEDPTREGLLDTPRRVVKAWGEMFAGYHMKPEDIATTFEAEGYNELVLLKDIEFYSTCEHHMLSFSGRAHIGYIPQGRIIGISKLARILDIFARRLQIQERLGQQVTQALNKLLEPIGSACIIEARHLCMRCRGVEKQQSTMITSSLTGVFLEQTDRGLAARAELMSLIRG